MLVLGTCTHFCMQTVYHALLRLEQLPMGLLETFGVFYSYGDICSASLFLHSYLFQPLMAGHYYYIY